MRLSRSRISALSDAELTEEQAELLASYRQGDAVANIFRTFVQAPDALRQLTGWIRYILSKRSSLSHRPREILILRTGFLCRCGYEFAQHVPLGLRAGLTPDEIEAIKKGAGSGWSEAEAALILAADELHADAFVSDATWALLRKHYSERQCMDVVFTVGQYVQISMFLNTFGVQIDEGLASDPDLSAL